jgi:hypothetical protein
VLVVDVVVESDAEVSVNAGVVVVVFAGTTSGVIVLYRKIKGINEIRNKKRYRRNFLGGIQERSILVERLLTKMPINKKKGDEMPIISKSGLLRTRSGVMAEFCTNDNSSAI